MNVKYRRKNLKSYSDGVTKIEPKIARKGDDWDSYLKWCDFTPTLEPVLAQSRKSE